MRSAAKPAEPEPNSTRVPAVRYQPRKPRGAELHRWLMVKARRRTVIMALRDFVSDKSGNHKAPGDY